MTISFYTPVLAPLTAGRPASLPPDKSQVDRDDQVKSVSAKPDATGSQTAAAEQQTTAPPTVMQRKIMEILEQQAQELDQS